MYLQYSIGNLLYSAATTQSTIDYSSKVVKDGIVDSPPSHGIPVVMNFFYPLRDKATVESSKSRESIGVQRNLYLKL